VTEAEAILAFRELGVSPVEFHGVKHAPSLVVAQQLLGELQTRAKKGYKAAARRYHPDLHGDDPDKAERLRLVTDAYKQIQELAVRQPPRRRRVRVGQPAGGNSRTWTVNANGIRIRVRFS